MTTAVAASAEAEAPPPPAAPDVLSYLYGRILERNARETEPFSAVHESNRALRSTVQLAAASRCAYALWHAVCTVLIKLIKCAASA